jgi:hypothetical protein
MLIHPVIANMSDEEIKSFINFLYDGFPYEKLLQVVRLDFLLSDSFLSVLDSTLTHKTMRDTSKNELDVKHLSDLRISSLSGIVDEILPIATYSVRGRLFLYHGNRYFHGSKGTLFHYKSLNLFIMIVNLGTVVPTGPNYMGTLRKILSCYYYFTEDIVYKNTNKIYMVQC